MEKRIREIGEFELIDQIKKKFLHKDDLLIKGIGDDTAVIKFDETRSLLITTDMMVEQIDFLRSKITPFQLGYKSLAINLSDIASMGGKPAQILISLGIPDSLPLSYIDQLLDGIKSLTDKYSISLAGGDMSSVKSDITISITALGIMNTEQVLYRDNAKPDDKIFLTKKTGDSAGGLEIILNNYKIENSSWKHMINEHYMPKPHVEEGMFLAETGLVNSMIDVSDGLSSDLHHICSQSDVGAILEKKLVPLSSSLKNFCKAKNLDPYQFALSGGEDFCLLFTANKKNAEKLEREYINKFDKRLHCVGIITEEQKLFLKDDFRKTEIYPDGYKHF